MTLAAIVGDQLGYYIGYRTGPRIFRRQDSLLFKRDHLIRAREFYERHGGKTIILARFVPIIRTFAPFVAGIGTMSYARFIVYNVVGAMLWVVLFTVGGFLWVWSMTLLGVTLGNVIPDIDRHIHVVIAVVVFLSILPAIIEYFRSRGRVIEPPL